MLYSENNTYICSEISIKWQFAMQILSRDRAAHHNAENKKT